MKTASLRVLIGLLLIVVTTVRMTEGVVIRSLGIVCPASCVLDMAAGHWLKESGGTLAKVNPDDCAVTCKDSCLMSQDPNKPNKINYICGPSSLICNWKEDKSCAMHIQDSQTGESLEIEILLQEALVDIKERAGSGTSAGDSADLTEEPTAGVVGFGNATSQAQLQLETVYSDTKCPKCRSPGLSKVDCMQDKYLNETCLDDEKCFVFKLERSIPVKINDSITIELEQIIRCIAQDIVDAGKGCNRSECTGKWWHADDPHRRYDSTSEQQLPDRTTAEPDRTTAKLEQTTDFNSVHCSNPACIGDEWCQGVIMNDDTIVYGCNLGCSGDDNCRAECYTNAECRKILHGTAPQTSAKPPNKNKTTVGGSSNKTVAGSSNKTVAGSSNKTTVAGSSNKTKVEYTPNDTDTDKDKPSIASVITFSMITYLTVTVAWLFY